MSTKPFLRVLIVSVLFLGFLPQNGYRVSASPSAQLSQPAMGIVDASHNPANLPNIPGTLNYEFAYVKQTVALWADGKGDQIIEQHVTNTSTSTSDVFDQLTWWFRWPSNNYSNVRAKDSAGPLKTKEQFIDNVEYVTVYFRKALPIGETYNFKFYLTIGEMAGGSGDNWSVNWYTTIGGNVKSFEEEIAIPANANVASISPTASERHGNIITWRYSDQTNWTLTVYVPYKLSNSISVPLFLQKSSPWGGDIYANSGDTMANLGCFTTSGAMLVNYFAATQGRASRTDPGELNTWMINNGGYTAPPYNGVKHAWFGKEARSKNISMYWNKSIGANNTTLDYYLRSGYPVILGVDPKTDPTDGHIYPGHYVVATGKTTVSGEDTYVINDPVYGETTLLKQWNNKYITMVLFSASETGQQLMYFVAMSPVEYVVVDPLGRKSGYDPTTGKVWNEIPGATYLYEGLAPEDGGTPKFAKTLSIPEPLDGKYESVLYGTGSGSYKFEVSNMDWQGAAMEKLYSGTVSTGQVVTYTVGYNQVINLAFLPIMKK
jgi:hypothetical protein